MREVPIFKCQVARVHAGTRTDVAQCVWRLVLGRLGTCSTTISMSRFIISCGGTGGHLSPGISLAEGLRRGDMTRRLLISQKKVDARLSEKYPRLRFERMPGSGFAWHPWKLVQCVVSQAQAFWFCLRLIRTRPPRHDHRLRRIHLGPAWCWPVGCRACRRRCTRRIAFRDWRCEPRPARAPRLSAAGHSDRRYPRRRRRARRPAGPPRNRAPLADRGARMRSASIRTSGCSWCSAAARERRRSTSGREASSRPSPPKESSSMCHRNGQGTGGRGRIENEERAMPIRRCSRLQRSDGGIDVGGGSGRFARRRRNAGGADSL